MSFVGETRIVGVAFIHKAAPKGPKHPATRYLPKSMVMISDMETIHTLHSRTFDP